MPIPKPILRQLDSSIWRLLRRFLVCDQRQHDPAGLQGEQHSEADAPADDTYFVDFATKVAR